MTSHWAMRFYERHHGYQPGAEGPDTYDCWGLVRAVEREHYGRELPVVPVEVYEGGRGTHAVIRGILESHGWHCAAAPRDGDGVVMRRPTGDLHVGVWLEIDGGRVLHCIEGAGVVVSTPLQLYAASFGALEYYTPSA